MLAHYLAYIVDCIPLGSLAFFTPTIVAGLGYKSIEAQLMTVPQWIIGYCVSLSMAWSTDHFNARGFHVAALSTIGGIGWIAATVLPVDPYHARYGCLTLCACGAFPSNVPLTAWVTCNVPAIACMGLATALNNSGAGVGSVISQWIWIPFEAKDEYPTANAFCAACSLTVAFLALGLRLYYGIMNARGALDANGKPRVWLL